MLPEAESVLMRGQIHSTPHHKIVRTYLTAVDLICCAHVGELVADDRLIRTWDHNVSARNAMLARNAKKLFSCSVNTLLATDVAHGAARVGSTYTVDQATNIKWYEGAVPRCVTLPLPPIHLFGRIAFII